MNEELDSQSGSSIDDEWGAGFSGEKEGPEKSQGNPPASAAGSAPEKGCCGKAREFRQRKERKQRPDSEHGHDTRHTPYRVGRAGQDEDDGQGPSAAQPGRG